MLVTTPEKDILEMNTSSIPSGPQNKYFVTVRTGGHIQRIANTASSTRKVAEEMLIEIAEEIKAGISVIGTSDGRPVIKTAPFV